MKNSQLFAVALDPLWLAGCLAGWFLSRALTDGLNLQKYRWLHYLCCYILYIIIFTWQMALIISQHCLWSLGNSGCVQMKTCHVPSPPALNYDYWFIYCMWTFTQEVLCWSLCNIQASQTFIKPNSWTGWGSCTKWHKILEYPNEIHLKWGQLSNVRTCTAATRSLLGFASVFFFSWLE